MRTAIVGLLAETSLHPGTGQSTGVIDLPVAREAVTNYPVIVGSSLKGALRERAEQYHLDNPEANLNPGLIFGSPNNAGGMAVTDARLLLLPVRSLSGHYKWATCPYLLERYKRDRQLAGMDFSCDVPRPQSNYAVLSEGKGQLFLEELSFEIELRDLTGLAGNIAPLIYHQTIRDRLSSRVVVLNDDDFVYFASYGLQVNARNELDDNTKTSKNLWYEETLPPDSLFYSLLIALPGNEEVLKQMQQVFQDRPYLQVGGNETVGQGWCAISWVEDGGES